MTGSAAWPLVGREADVAHGAELLRRGRGVTLVGEAGVGKTSLARAVLGVLEAEGWATAAFEAGPAAGAVPFLPFASLLRSDREGSLERLVEAAATLAGRGERVAALVDDAHALDDVSLGFVSHLLAATDVRLVLTVRSGEAAARLVRAWTDALPRFEVSPLDRRTSDAVVRTVLGDVEPAALRWVWETTGGNALFVRELLADAVERGALVERGGRWRVAEGARPPGRRLQDVVADRVGALSDAERDAVELLAVGAPIGLRMLEELVGGCVVQDLERRGLVAPDRSGSRVVVRLAHPIHGEVVGGLLGPSTVAFHRRRLLEATSGAGDRRRGDRLRVALWRMELGDTGDPAGLLAAAEDLVALAGERPRDGGDDAVSAGPQLLARAVQLTRAAFEGGAGLDAATQLIGLLTRLGRHEEARAVRDLLDDLVVDEADRVRVVRTLADVDSLILGDPAVAAARLAEVEGIVTSPALVRSLQASRAGVLVVAGEARAALEVARAVLADPDATVSERIRASAAMATALGSAGRTAEALEVLAQAEPLLEHEDAGMRVTLVLPRIFVLGCAGRLDDLDQLLTVCHALSEQHGLDDGVAIFAATLANAALLRGRPRTALTWVDASLRHVGDLDPVGVRRLAHAARAQAQALLGDADAASAAVDVLDAMGPHSLFRDDETRARAWTHVVRGHRERALLGLVRGADEAAGRGDVTGAIGHLHLAARLGAADLVAERVAALAEEVDGVLLPTQAARVAALAADDADALEWAGKMFEDAGFLLDAAEAYADAAASHRRAARRSRSSAAAACSRELAASCEGASTPALVGAEPLASLTRREREVAQLAAEGLSDRAIADRLVVSIRTVETHLYNAYAKLGVDGRAGLAEVVEAY